MPLLSSKVMHINIIVWWSLYVNCAKLHIAYSSSVGWDQPESTFCYWIHFILTLWPRSEVQFWSKLIVFGEEFNALSVLKIQGFFAIIRHQNKAKIRDPYDHGVCLNFGWKWWFLKGNFRLNPWLKHKDFLPSSGIKIKLRFGTLTTTEYT